VFSTTHSDDQPTRIAQACGIPSGLEHVFFEPSLTASYDEGETREEILNYDPDVS
jgi:hypothetical protein